MGCVNKVDFLTTLGIQNLEAFKASFQALVRVTQCRRLSWNEVVTSREKNTSRGGHVTSRIHALIASNGKQTATNSVARLSRGDRTLATKRRVISGGPSRGRGRWRRGRGRER